MNYLRRSTTLTHMLIKQELLKRSYASIIKIDWKRPPKEPSFMAPKSGDLVQLKEYDKSEIVLDFKCKSLEELDKNSYARKVFTLEFNKQEKANDLYKKELEDRVRRHAFDTDSIEIKIARCTAVIRILQKHFKNFPYDRQQKVRLIESVDKRNAYLRQLRKWDYKRFEWVLEKLDIVYRPIPIGEKVERKKSIRRLVEIQCKTIKEAKVGEHKKLLDEQKVPFYENKLAKLEWIKQKEEKFDLEPSVSDEDIENCKKKLEELKLETETYAQKVYVRKVDLNTLELYEP